MLNWTSVFLCYRMKLYTSKPNKPEIGFAGYMKKIRPDTRYFIQFEK